MNDKATALQKKFLLFKMFQNKINIQALDFSLLGISFPHI